MEFNAVQQCRSTEPFPLFEQRPQDETSLMLAAASTMASHGSITQPMGLPPAQAIPAWPQAGNKPINYPQQWHDTTLLEGRTMSTGPPAMRPYRVTSPPTFQPGGLQNPQGEYLPQPNMPPPTVQPTKMAQATTIQNDWMHSMQYNEYDINNLDADISDYMRGAMGADDNTTIIDLRKFANGSHEHVHDLFLDPSRRMSESTHSMSSNGQLADVPAFDDVPSSENHRFCGGDRASFETSVVKPQQDPSSSPRGSHALMRTASRSRGSPAPNMRASPYTLDSTRNKRWSTGMYPGQAAPQPPQMTRYSSYMSSPLYPQNGFSSLPAEAIVAMQRQNYMYPQAAFDPNAGMYFGGHDHYMEAPQPLPSHGMFRTLSSNADHMRGCYSNCADLADPPDLYSSLYEEPSDPPEEDMHPEDPDMTPYEQELRFPGDLYTPKWVRGHGNKREGWCGLCKPGRWLVLKNSAFWYDKSFTHGVSAATGAAFQGPQETRRTDGNLDVWEGLCGSCGDWIALVSSKKKGTTWFRHAYKCHTHPKVKDGPKRRREIVAPASKTTATNIAKEAVDEKVQEQKSKPGPPEPPKDKTPVSSTDDAEVAVKVEEKNSSFKIEDEVTPVSTPQLTHTSLSTPQLSTMQTPGSHHTSTAQDQKRFSVAFDGSMFSNSFSSPNDNFGISEPEQGLSKDQPIPSVETTTEPEGKAHDASCSTFSHDHSFNRAPSFSLTDSHHGFGDLDHYMNTDYSHNDFSLDFANTSSHPHNLFAMTNLDGFSTFI